MFGYGREPWEDAEAYYVGMERPDKRYRVEMEAEVWPDAEGDLKTIELAYEVEARDEEEARDIAEDKCRDDLRKLARAGKIYDDPGEYEVKDVWQA